MHLRVKLSNSAFDPETGISTVTVKTKRGTYTGVSKVHPDDKEIQSKYTGLRIAEMKAVRKAYKDELKRERIILHVLPSIQKDLIHTLDKYSAYQAFAWAQVLIKRRFYFMTESHKKRIDLIEEKIEAINHALEENKKFLKQIKEKRSKK